VRLDRKARKGVSRVKEKVYKKTSVNSIRPKQKMRMEVNTSDYAMEEILSMKCENVW